MLIATLMYAIRANQTHQFPITTIMTTRRRVSNQFLRIILIRRVFSNNSISKLTFTDTSNSIPDRTLHTVFIFYYNYTFIRVPITMIRPSKITNFLLISIFITKVNRLIFIFNNVTTVTNLTTYLSSTIFINIRQMTRM